MIGIVVTVKANHEPLNPKRLLPWQPTLIVPIDVGAYVIDLFKFIGVTIPPILVRDDMMSQIGCNNWIPLCQDNFPFLVRGMTRFLDHRCSRILVDLDLPNALR